MSFTLKQLIAKRDSFSRGSSEAQHWNKQINEGNYVAESITSSTSFLPSSLPLSPSSPTTPDPIVTTSVSEKTRIPTFIEHEIRQVSGVRQIPGVYTRREFGELPEDEEEEVIDISTKSESVEDYDEEIEDEQLFVDILEDEIVESVGVTEPEIFSGYLKPRLSEDPDTYVESFVEPSEVDDPVVQIQTDVKVVQPVSELTTEDIKDLVVYPTGITPVYIPREEEDEVEIEESESLKYGVTYPTGISPDMDMDAEDVGPTDITETDSILSVVETIPFTIPIIEDPEDIEPDYVKEKPSEVIFKEAFPTVIEPFVSPTIDDIEDIGPDYVKEEPSDVTFKEAFPIIVEPLIIPVIEDVEDIGPDYVKEELSDVSFKEAFPTIEEPFVSPVIEDPEDIGPDYVKEEPSDVTFKEAFPTIVEPFVIPTIEDSEDIGPDYVEEEPSDVTFEEAFSVSSIPFQVPVIGDIEDIDPDYVEEEPSDVSFKEAFPTIEEPFVSPVIEDPEDIGPDYVKEEPSDVTFKEAFPTIVEPFVIPTIEDSEDIGPDYVEEEPSDVIFEEAFPVSSIPFQVPVIGDIEDIGPDYVEEEPSDVTFEEAFPVSSIPFQVPVIGDIEDIGPDYVEEEPSDVTFKEAFPTPEIIPVIPDLPKDVEDIFPAISFVPEGDVTVEEALEELLGFGSKEGIIVYPTGIEPIVSTSLTDLSPTDIEGLELVVPDNINNLEDLLDWMKGISEKAFEASNFPSEAEISEYYLAHGRGKILIDSPTINELFNRFKYALTEMIIGGVSEVTIPFSFGKAPAERPTDVVFRIAGGLLTPSPADVIATLAIGKIFGGLKKLGSTGKKIIRKFANNEILDVDEIIQFEKMTGELGTSTYDLRNLAKRLDLSDDIKNSWFSVLKKVEDKVTLSPEELRVFENIKRQSGYSVTELRNIISKSGIKNEIELENFIRTNKKYVDYWNENLKNYAAGAAYDPTMESSILIDELASIYGFEDEYQLINYLEKSGQNTFGITPESLVSSLQVIMAKEEPGIVGLPDPEMEARRQAYVQWAASQELAEGEVVSPVVETEKEKGTGPPGIFKAYKQKGKGALPSPYFAEREGGLPQPYFKMGPGGIYTAVEPDIELEEVLDIDKGVSYSQVGLPIERIDIRDIMEEEDIIDSSIIEEPVIEEPIVEPVIEEPIVEPVIEEPIVEPVIEEPIVEPVIIVPPIDIPDIIQGQAVTQATREEWRTRSVGSESQRGQKFRISPHDEYERKDLRVIKPEILKVVKPFTFNFGYEDGSGESVVVFSDSEKSAMLEAYNEKINPDSPVDRDILVPNINDVMGLLGKGLNYSKEDLVKVGAIYDIFGGHVDKLTEGLPSRSANILHNEYEFNRVSVLIKDAFAKERGKRNMAREELSEVYPDVYDILGEAM